MSRYTAIKVCEASMRCKEDRDRGWRTRVEYDPDYALRVQLIEEQVLPEKVYQADVNITRAENGRVELDLDEARWLHTQLSLVIAQMERDEAELERYLADKHAEVRR